MCALIINLNLATAGRGHFEEQKHPQIRKNFEKKNCFTPDSNLGITIYLSTTTRLDQEVKSI